MLSYQWPFRGRKLIQTLNYANSFAFMLYGWDAGKEFFSSFHCFFSFLFLADQCVPYRSHWWCPCQPLFLESNWQSDRLEIHHFHRCRYSTWRRHWSRPCRPSKLASGKTQDCYALLHYCYHRSYPSNYDIFVSLRPIFLSHNNRVLISLASLSPTQILVGRVILGIANGRT